MNKERVQYWLDQGATPTDRVLRFLDAEGMAKREARNNPNKAKPGRKAQERLEEKAQKGRGCQTGSSGCRGSSKNCSR